MFVIKMLRFYIFSRLDHNFEGVKRNFRYQRLRFYIISQLDHSFEDVKRKFCYQRLRLFFYFSTGSQLWRSKTKCSLSKGFVFIFFLHNFERVKQKFSFCYQNVLILNCFYVRVCIAGTISKELYDRWHTVLVSLWTGDFETIVIILISFFNAYAICIICFQVILVQVGLKIYCQNPIIFFWFPENLKVETKYV